MHIPVLTESIGQFFGFSTFSQLIFIKRPGATSTLPGFLADIAVQEDGYPDDAEVYADSMSHIKGKKRARRAKGKKKKQKTSLMITNDDGTDSTTQVNKNRFQEDIFFPKPFI